ncbi:MAG: LysR substrate-binding domain-containing protein [Burkholderiaceae bacterium]
MFDLKTLKYFVVLAEELHFGRAADKLHISQPPLSLKIRTLETELGLQLFQRSSRRVELTHSGHILLPEARRVLRDAEQLVKLAASLELGEAGTLSIGFNALLAYRLMPQLVSAFSERYPQVKVTLHEMVSSEQVVALLEHQIDVGLLRPPLPPGFRSLSLGSEEMVVFLPAKHPLANQETIPLTALAREPMLMFSRGESSYLHNLTMDMCTEAGFQPVVRQETRHIHAIVALVGTGMGVALLPASAGFIHMDGIAIRRLMKSDASVGTRRAHTVLATLEGNANPALRPFLAFVQATATTVENSEPHFGGV